MISILDGPAIGQRFSLNRSPIILRVVYDNESKKFDALNQLAEQAEAIAWNAAIDDVHDELINVGSAYYAGYIKDRKKHVPEI